MSPITAGPPDPAQPRSRTRARAALDQAQSRMERAWHEYASADPARTTTGYQQQLYDAYLDALDAWIWAVRADQRQIEQRGGR